MTKRSFNQVETSTWFAFSSSLSDQWAVKKIKNKKKSGQGEEACFLVLVSHVTGMISLCYVLLLDVNWVAKAGRTDNKKHWSCPGSFKAANVDFFPSAFFYLPVSNQFSCLLLSSYCTVAFRAPFYWSPNVLKGRKKQSTFVENLARVHLLSSNKCRDTSRGIFTTNTIILPFWGWEVVIFASAESHALPEEAHEAASVATLLNDIACKSSWHFCFNSYFCLCHKSYFLWTT